MCIAVTQEMERERGNPVDTHPNVWCLSCRPSLHASLFGLSSSLGGGILPAARCPILAVHPLQSAATIVCRTVVPLCLRRQRPPSTHLTVCCRISSPRSRPSRCRTQRFETWAVHTVYYTGFIGAGLPAAETAVTGTYTPLLLEASIRQQFR